MLINKCLVCGFLELMKPIFLYLPMQEKNGLKATGKSNYQEV